MNGCRICGNVSIKPVYALGKVAVYECGRCGTRFIDRQRLGDEQERFEREYYESTFQRYFQSRSRAKLYSKWFLRAAGSGGGGRLMDVGCGRGDFLSLVSRERGWEVYGCDISGYAVDYAREKYGLKNIRRGELSGGCFPPESFDIVTLFDVLEHVEDPVGTLRQVHRVLRPGGRLFLTTVNRSSVLFDACAWAYKLTAGRWRGPLVRLFHPHNLFYFNRSSLDFILDKNRFTLLRLSTYSLPLEAMRGSRLLKMPVFVLGRVLARQNRFFAIAGKA